MNRRRRRRGGLCDTLWSPCDGHRPEDRRHREKERVVGGLGAFLEAVLGVKHISVSS